MTTLDWRMQLHAELTNHPFVQDPDDIPGGCATCWAGLKEPE